jgi:hypothetical protein
MSHFVEANRDQPFLLPPDLREWVPEGDVAHFVLEAAVDADGSYRNLGARVRQCASEGNERVADIEAIPKAIGPSTGVLADNGYAHNLQSDGLSAGRAFIRHRQLLVQTSASSVGAGSLQRPDCGLLRQPCSRAP